VTVPIGMGLRDELLVAASAASAEEPAEGTLGMNEAEFKAFYEQTSSAVWGYLCRVLGNASLADDVLQESYVRVLRARNLPADAAHRRNYLFRIATNLARDHFRASRRQFVPLPDIASSKRADRDLELRSDLKKFLLKLTPRERELLWLAYAEGCDHQEIAEALECKAVSVRPMLFRARQRLMEVLRSAGWSGKAADQEGQ